MYIDGQVIGNSLLPIMICISSLDRANIAEGVPTLKQHLSFQGVVSVGGVNMFVYPA